MNRVSPFVFLLAGAVISHGALAQAYPANPIRVIVPAQAGATYDTLTRLIGQKVGERLGQSLIVDNRAGAGGMIGLELTARMTPDGYTIACGQGGNLVVVPHTYKKVPYDALKDFAPIALIATNYLALASHPSAPFKAVEDDRARARHSQRVARVLRRIDQERLRQVRQDHPLDRPLNAMRTAP